MTNFRVSAAAAVLVLGFTLSAEAGPQVWTADRSHNANNGSVHVFAAPKLRSSSSPETIEYVEPVDVEDKETAKTFTVTTVRPSRRWFRRNRALGQRYLGFKRQYTGQRYTGFKKIYRVRRNVVKVSRGTIKKGKNGVIISKALAFPRARGTRDFRPSPEVTIIRYD